jgi:hypothetical protein
VTRQCDSCGETSSRAARYCQWCGDNIRELRAFETSDTDEKDNCPCCGGGPAEVSWQTAPGQLVCDSTDCPVRTYGGIPAGEYATEDADA